MARLAVLAVLVLLLASCGSAADEPLDEDGLDADSFFAPGVSTAARKATLTAIEAAWGGDLSRVFWPDISVVPRCVRG